jgi:hypothetical protein
MAGDRAEALAPATSRDGDGESRGLDVQWIRDQIVRHGLFVWFAANSIVGIAYAARDTTLLYFDARLYIMATQTWLAGGDPWQVQLAGNYFAAPPPSLLPLVPVALLPLDLGVAVIATLVIVAAVATVRMLRLPWWWLLFPPLVQCVLSANVQGLLIPLILLRAGAIASFLKIYAVVPVVVTGRWRAALLTAALLVVTIPLLPWGTYIAEFALINSHLTEQTKYALPTLFLVLISPVALLAMAVVGRERAAWLAVPAIWPSQQYYYGTLAMGARSDLAAAIVSIPIPGSGLVALFILAAVTWRREGSARWRETANGLRRRIGPSAR